MSTTLHQASNRFEKYLALSLEDAVRSGVIDAKKRSAMGEVGAFLVPVSQKGTSSNAKGPRPALGQGLVPRLAQGPGLGPAQEQDKRVDVRLGGRGLGDDVIKCVFRALSKARLIAYIRDIDVHANDLTCGGVVAICDAFLGVKHKKGSRRQSQKSGGLGE